MFYYRVLLMRLSNLFDATVFCYSVSIDNETENKLKVKKFFYSIKKWFQILQRKFFIMDIFIWNTQRF